MSSQFRFKIGQRGSANNRVDPLPHVILTTTSCYCQAITSSANLIVMGGHPSRLTCIISKFTFV